MSGSTVPNPDPHHNKGAARPFRAFAPPRTDLASPVIGLEGRPGPLTRLSFRETSHEGETSEPVLILPGGRQLIIHQPGLGGLPGATMMALPRRQPDRCGLCRRKTKRSDTWVVHCERCGDMFHEACYWRIASRGEWLTLYESDRPYSPLCARCRS